MGLLDKIAELFGRSSSAAPAAPQGPKKPLSKQVYEGPSDIEEPEWAQEMPKAKLLEACLEHAVCKYKLHVELKRIMSTRRGFDGNLEAEYDGLAGGCGALKNFGLTVAKRDGYLQPYRYVDLNHIYACCCDKFRRCPFYGLAEGSEKDLQTRQRRI
jgi:hypothetical protein